MNYFNFGNSAEVETRRKIHKMIKAIKDITSYTRLEELKLDRFQLRRIVAIIQNKDEEETYIVHLKMERPLFTSRGRSYYTGERLFFKPNNLDNFNVVFTIGIKYYIYSTRLKYNIYFSATFVLPFFLKNNKK